MDETYPLDEQSCLLCGAPAIAWPEGNHHSDASRDADHLPVINRWEP